MKKKEINISNSFPMKFKKTIALILVVFLVSCQQKIYIADNAWAVESIDLNEFSKIETDSSSNREIEKFKIFFSRNPYEKDYREIMHSVTYLDVKSGDRYYVFDILGVDDIEVIFQERRNERAVKAFLHSSWG